MLVARIRMLLVSGIILVQLVPDAAPLNQWVALRLNGLALAVACLLYALAWRAYRPWLAFMSSAVDVTMVTSGLATFLLLDRPHAAVQSWALFDAYFLAVTCASLRYNWRVCVFAGLLAVAQYATIVAYTVSRFRLDDPRYAPFSDGVFDGSVQIARLVLLAAAGVLSTAIVLRAQRLRRLSTTDRLTGIANRGAFDERLEEEASRARRYERPVTVAVIDVDQFKRFNDAHGHAGGDTVLRVLADAFAASVRRSDTVARYGGEEFALILPETSAQMAMDRLEALRRIVAAIPIDTGTGEGPVGVTVSIGVASWPEDGADINAVLACADGRLYEAKRLGRNRTLGPRAATHERSQP
ncbi:MAG: GGDEF domain-containing protein, partial [Candidatus Rokuibacteriota bacterium]